jgi:glycine oxidase
MTVMDRTQDVLILGGGIVGAAIAERLAREGTAVTLVERGVVGGEASWAAAGLLTPVHPWNYPEPLLRLDAESLALWGPLAERLRDETGIDVEMRRTGLLDVIAGEEDEREADRRVAWKRAHGERAQRLSAAEARCEEPLLAETIRGALLLPDLAQVRNHRAAPAFAAAAARRGARIVERTAVLGLLMDGDRVAGAVTEAGQMRAATTVLAAGAWSGGLLGGACPPALRTVPCRGQMLLLRTVPGRLRHMVLAAGQYLVPRTDGRVLAGSTVEHVGFDSSVTAAGLASIGAAVARIAPALAAATVERSWAGLRPDSPDHMPSLGWVRPGLLAATGHFRSGIMLAPVTAEIVLDLVRGRAGRDLSPFDPRRVPAVG